MPVAAGHIAPTVVATKRSDDSAFVKGAATMQHVSMHEPACTHALQQNSHLLQIVAITLVQLLWLILLILDREGRSSVLKAHTGTVRCVNFSADGKLLITAGDDKTVKVRYSSCINHNQRLSELSTTTLHDEPLIGAGICADQPVYSVRNITEGSQGLRAAAARHANSAFPEEA